MKISIITVCLNSAETIGDTIESVLSQTHPDIEYIIVDGMSIDGTQNIVKKYGNKISKFISERDEGIYHAWNKGLKLAGGDVIGFLSADDVYANKDVICDVVSALDKNKVESCYGDLVYVKRTDINKVVRYWQSGNFDKNKFKTGWAPPCPTFFASKKIYAKYGGANTAFKFAADYELVLRFLYKHNNTTTYIPKVMVKMRTGGHTRPGISRTVKATIECYNAWRINKLRINPAVLLLKPLSKIFQFKF